MSFRNFKNWLHENTDWQDDDNDDWWKGEPEKPKEEPQPNIGRPFWLTKNESWRFRSGVKNMWGVWKGIPFNSVKQDPNGGYYFDWAVQPGMIADLEEVQPGDKIGDDSLNNDAYWIVDHVMKLATVYMSPLPKTIL